jgi:hypothetical protein
MEIHPAPPDASDDEQIWIPVHQFCTGCAQAFSRSEILLDKPWTDAGRTWFRSKALLQHLSRYRVSGYGGSKLWKLLRERGGTHEKVSIKGVDTQIWSVPEFQSQKEGFDVPKSITASTVPF